MDKDQELVVAADLALVAATQKYIQASPLERLSIKPDLDRARAGWVAARYRLLFPDTLAVQQDIDDAGAIRQRIETAADRQQLIQGLIDLAGLLLKYAH